MSIEKFDFDSIDDNDLQELIDAQVPEGLKIDFKLTNYGNSDKDKKELLKDVSALANSHGGHLVLGVEESEGVASKIVGIEIDADSEI
jgi:predicted HTH transcriptional regulator